MIKAHIAQLMDKEMDRKSFLTHVAAASIAVFGASAAVKALSSASPQQPLTAPKVAAGATSAFAYGYGGAPYGY